MTFTIEVQPQAGKSFNVLSGDCAYIELDGSLPATVLGGTLFGTDSTLERLVAHSDGGYINIDVEGPVTRLSVSQLGMHTARAIQVRRGHIYFIKKPAANVGIN
jgi:hypothetical protein